MCRSIKHATLLLGSPFIAVLIALPFVRAQEPLPASTPAPAAAQQTLIGEVVDPAAFVKDGSRGVEMTEQSYTAVDGGQTLALLEEGSGNLYIFFAEQTGEDPNELVYDYVNQRVTAKGTVYEKGGLRGFVAVSVEPASSETPAAAAAAN